MTTRFKRLNSLLDNQQELDLEYTRTQRQKEIAMNNHKYMQLATLKELLSKTNGRFFTVTFKKKDGSLRTINGRTGVHKYLKGGKATFDAQDKVQQDWTVGVWETKKGYRCFKASQVTSITTNGLTVNFE